MSVLTPLISVLMPVYNAERFLRSAIDSVLQQTFSDFELILIDDGSTDKSAAIIASYSDGRMIYLKNEHNSGIVQSLKNGLQIAKGAFIARMDADDISLPDRFLKQVNFLQANPDIGICGTNAITIDAEDNKKRIWYYASEPDKVKISRTFVCPFLHPTIMIRKDILQEANSYTPGMEPAEDFELWIRVLQITKGANLPDILLYYRTESGSYSERKKSEALLRLAQIFTLHQHILATDLSHVHFHARSIYGDWSGMTANDLQEMGKWLKNLLRINREIRAYDVHLFPSECKKYMVNNYLKIMSQNTGKVKWRALWQAISVSPIMVKQIIERKMKSEKP